MRHYLLVSFLFLTGCLAGREVEADEQTADGVTEATSTAATASSASPSNVVDLSLLTYNVQARPVLDDRRARRNLPVVGELLNEFDIAGVQECFSHADLLLGATTHPTHFYFDHREHWYSLANSGLLSVARFPAREIATVHYSREWEWGDFVASKGIVLLSLDVQGHVVDVYNTHMQAGASDGAASAREVQGRELVQFVQAHSPRSHSVILHGDFNMGPARPGKAFADFSPQHYASEDDMQKRTRVFSAMAHDLELADVSDTLFGPTMDYIDRVLYRAADGDTLVPTEWRDNGSRFVDSAGAPLSDSAPVSVRFHLATGGGVTGPR
jgi:endonuclease/exonuclease/phosphatase family metal-dependent hydrolase